MVPLHTNLSEGHLRDYVKKRKISGGTRSESGRQARDTFASLKKTCRELGVNFWAYLQDRVRRSGPNAPLGGADPPQGGGDSGQEGRCRAAGVGGWRRGGKNAKAMAPQDFRAILAPTRCAPRLPTVIEKLQRRSRENKSHAGNPYRIYSAYLRNALTSQELQRHCLGPLTHNSAPISHAAQGLTSRYSLEICGISGIMLACPKRRWQNGTDQSDGCPVAENG